MTTIPNEEEQRPRCRCSHDTANPEVGCTCGYADFVADHPDPTTWEER